MKTVLHRFGFLVVLALAAAQPARPAAGGNQFHIAGTVVLSSTGQPLAGTEVGIGLVSQPGDHHNVVTDANGRFVFDGLARGKYWLAARRRGFPRQFFDEHEGFSTAIAVGPDLASDSLVFRLRPGGSITGTISDDHNEAVRDAQVLLFRVVMEDGKRSTTRENETGTDDRGRYKFSGLSAGTYFVAVSAQPWYAQYVTEGSDDGTSPLDLAYPITFYPSVTDEKAATPVSLNPGEQAVADVTLLPVPAVHFEMKSAGAEAPNVTFSQQVFDDALPMLAVTTVDSQGNTRYDGLPPAQVSMTVRTSGKRPTVANSTTHLYEGAEITAGQAMPLVPVSGSVFVDGVPATARAIVQLSPVPSGDSTDGRVNAKGEFQLTDGVPPGAYDVSVFRMPRAVVRSVSAADGKPSVGNRISITSPNPVHLDIEMSRNLATVDGMAMRGDKPAPGVMILLVPRDLKNHPALVRRDQSDSDGTFTLPLVLPGSYTLVALERGWDLEWAEPQVLQPYLEHGEAIEVTSGKRLQVKVKVQ